MIARCAWQRPAKDDFLIQRSRAKRYGGSSASEHHHINICSDEVKTPRQLEASVAWRLIGIAGQGQTLSRLANRVQA